MSKWLLRLIFAALATAVAQNGMAQFVFIAMPDLGVTESTTCVSHCSPSVSSTNACFHAQSPTAPVHFTIVARNVATEPQYLLFAYSTAVISGIGHPVSTVHVDAPPGTFCLLDSVDGAVQRCIAFPVASGASVPFEVTVTPPAGGFTGSNAVTNFFNYRDLTGRICVSVEPENLAMPVPLLGPAASVAFIVALAAVALSALWSDA